jgi:hypothetical protein
MKISDLAKGARPIFCKFEDIDDNYGGVIAKEPVWQEDNYNSDREMLVVRLTCDGVPYELRARGQMIEAILAAVTAAKAEELGSGGYLSVTLTELRGKAKIYRAVYEPLEDEDHCACGDPRGLDPIGVGALEFDPDDPGDDQAAR